MSTPVDFLVVDEHVARNAVARAIARQRVKLAVRDFQVRLHMLEDGEFVPVDCQAAAKVLAVACAVLDLQGLADTTAARVMAGGMGALADMAKTRWIWRSRHAVAVDQALGQAAPVLTKAPAALIQKAYRKVADMERRAEANYAEPGVMRRAA